MIATWVVLTAMFLGAGLGSSVVLLVINIKRQKDVKRCRKGGDALCLPNHE